MKDCLFPQAPNLGPWVGPLSEIPRQTATSLPQLFLAPKARTVNHPEQKWAFIKVHFLPKPAINNIGGKAALPRHSSALSQFSPPSVFP
jgi:hypothetical protein